MSDIETKAKEIAKAILSGHASADIHEMELVVPILAALSEERERCAYLAECHTGLWDNATAENIAASIRNPEHVA